jgi:ribosomal protein L10
VEVRIETVEKLKDVPLKEMGVATKMGSTLQPSQEQVLKRLIIT